MCTLVAAAPPRVGVFVASGLGMIPADEIGAVDPGSGLSSWSGVADAGNGDVNASDSIPQAVRGSWACGKRSALEQVTHHPRPRPPHNGAVEERHFSSSAPSSDGNAGCSDVPTAALSELPESTMNGSQRNALYYVSEDNEPPELPPPPTPSPPMPPTLKVPPPLPKPTMQKRQPHPAGSSRPGAASAGKTMKKLKGVEKSKPQRRRRGRSAATPLIPPKNAASPPSPTPSASGVVPVYGPTAHDEVRYELRAQNSAYKLARPALRTSGLLKISQLARFVHSQLGLGSSAMVCLSCAGEELYEGDITLEQLANNVWPDSDDGHLVLDYRVDDPAPS